MSSKPNMIKELNRQIEDSPRASLVDRSMMVAESEKELMIVSETAGHHMESIREQSRQMPMLVLITQLLVFMYSSCSFNGD